MRSESLAKKNIFAEPSMTKKKAFNVDCQVPIAKLLDHACQTL